MGPPVTHYLVSVAIRDEPGALARVTRQLASWQINLKGLVVDPSGMRFLTQDHEAISHALEEVGFLYRIEEVQQVVLEDRPGSLSELCSRLAEASINITQVFGVASSATGHIFIAVDDWVRAAPILDLYTRGPTVVHAHLRRIA